MKDEAGDATRLDKKIVAPDLKPLSPSESEARAFFQRLIFPPLRLGIVLRDADKKADTLPPGHSLGPLFSRVRRDHFALYCNAVMFRCGEDP